jgi:hypothetical protein
MDDEWAAFEKEILTDSATADQAPENGESVRCMNHWFEACSLKHTHF